MSNKLNNYMKWLELKEKLKKNKRITLLIRLVKFKIIKPIQVFVYCGTRKIIWKLKKVGYIRLSRNEELLGALQNSHAGETVFIIGNGPSLKAADLDYVFDKHFYSFGSNRINMIFDETKWRPNAYCAIDRRLMFNDDATLDEVNRESIIELFIYSKVLYECLSDNLKKRESVYVYGKPTNFYREEKEFGVDPRIYFTDGYTVTNLAIQMAVFMGFKRICLLGIDCSYSNEIDANGDIKHHNGIRNYFKNRTEKDDSNAAFVSGMQQAYKVAKCYAEKNDIEIYNCSVDSKLNVFTNKDIRDIV